MVNHGNKTDDPNYTAETKLDCDWMIRSFTCPLQLFKDDAYNGVPPGCSGNEELQREFEHGLIISLKNKHVKGVVDALSSNKGHHPLHQGALRAQSKASLEDCEDTAIEKLKEALNPLTSRIASGGNIQQCCQDRGDSR